MRGECLKPKVRAPGQGVGPQGMGACSHAQSLPVSISVMQYRHK